MLLLPILLFFEEMYLSHGTRAAYVALEMLHSSELAEN